MSSKMNLSRILKQLQKRDRYFPNTDLNLIPRKRVTWQEYLWIITCSTTLLYIGYEYKTVNDKIENKQHYLNTLVKTSTNPTIPTEEVSSDEKDAQAKALLTLNFQWQQLFDAIEKTQTADVAILEVIPDANKKQLQISAQTMDVYHMLDYLETIRKAPLVGSVVLNTQVMSNDENLPLQFTLTANWR